MIFYEKDRSLWQLILTYLEEYRQCLDSRKQKNTHEVYKKVFVLKSKMKKVVYVSAEAIEKLMKGYFSS